MKATKRESEETDVGGKSGTELMDKEKGERMEG